MELVSDFIEVQNIEEEYPLSEASTEVSHSTKSKTLISSKDSLQSFLTVHSRVPG